MQIPKGYRWFECPQCYEQHGYSLLHEKCNNASCTGGGCNECVEVFKSVISGELKPPEEIRYRNE